MLIKVTDISFADARTKREVFEGLFPRGATVNVANARLATGAGLSLRCAAKQLMGDDALLAFQQQASKLLAIFMENTADTRDALRALNPYSAKLEWMDADTAHTMKKKVHWVGYMDGLSRAFVTGLEGAD